MESRFWLIATLMVVATTATLVVPLFWRPSAQATTSRRRWFAFAFSVATIVPLLALGLYAWWGRPDLIARAPVTAATADISTLHARAALRGGDTSGGDLGDAIDKLRARLVANPGDAAGWRLLAQSYQFLGRSAESAAADQRADALERGDTAAASNPVVDQFTSPPPATGLDAKSTRLAQQAEEHRRRREFPQAVKLFGELAKRGAMNADLWADYADALGSARGKLDADAAACIDSALRLDPEHAKALWLRASLQTQERDYRSALETWQRLSMLLPPDSPDARIIAANMAEARGNLAGVAAPAVTAGLRGSVRLDPRLVDRVTKGTVLFVFARAADERGPPLAVLRTVAGEWPLEFALDDSNAMMPGRKQIGRAHV